MLRSGAERIYGFGGPWQWDGRWLLVSLKAPENRREVRHLVRSQLAWAGFGSLGNGLWITPHVEREAELAALADTAPEAQVLAFRAELGDIGDPARVISEAWDLESVGEAYRDFIARFGRLSPKTPEAVFKAQTELVHAWRKFPYLDPDLPEQMLPTGWARSKARLVFEDQHAAWRQTAQVYFKTLEGLGHGPSTDRAIGSVNGAGRGSSKSARTASK
jgi:phenylacetic acid degradation operon negative regulatory protein